MTSQQDLSWYVDICIYRLAKHAVAGERDSLVHLTGGKIAIVVVDRQVHLYLARMPVLQF